MNVPVFSAGNNLIPTVRWNNSHFLADLQASENEIAAASFFLSFPGCARCQRGQWILSAFPMSWAAAPTCCHHPRPHSSLLALACCDLGPVSLAWHPVPCFLGHVKTGGGLSRLHTCYVSMFIKSSPHLFIHPSLIYSLSFIHSFTYHLFTHSVPHALAHSLIPSSTCSLI